MLFVLCLINIYFDVCLLEYIDIYLGISLYDNFNDDCFSFKFSIEADKHPSTNLLVTMRKELDEGILSIWVFGK